MPEAQSISVAQLAAFDPSFVYGTSGPPHGSAQSSLGTWAYSGAIASLLCRPARSGEEADAARCSAQVRERDNQNP